MDGYRRNDRFHDIRAAPESASVGEAERSFGTLRLTSMNSLDLLQIAHWAWWSLPQLDILREWVLSTAKAFDMRLGIVALLTA